MDFSIPTGTVPIFAAKMGLSPLHAQEAQSVHSTALIVSVAPTAGLEEDEQSGRNVSANWFPLRLEEG